MKKVSFDELENTLTRTEMKKIMAGSGGCSSPGQRCSTPAGQYCCNSSEYVCANHTCQRRTI